MTTTIVPAIGAGALFTQQGVGTAPGYSALDARRLSNGTLQEGVYGTPTAVTAGGVSGVVAADFMVTQRNAGANMSVDINMPSGGYARVNGDTIVGQGAYTVPVHGSNINETIAGADPTNPRIDQVILEVQDNALDATGGNLARIRVLTGTPTASATLANRLGAQALPGSSLLLADILVPNGSTSVPNSNIRDRRTWARGADVIITRNSGGNYTTTNALGHVDIDATNLKPRVECSGAPLEIIWNSLVTNPTAGDGVAVGASFDGSAIGDLTAVQNPGGANMHGGYVYHYTPPAGSHVISATFKALTGGTATIVVGPSTPAVFMIRECLVQNSPNNSVTSG